jgi:hypothetical protein
MPGVRLQVKRMKRTGVIMWLVIAMPLLSLGCAGNRNPHDMARHIIVKGRVVDESGRPVPQVKVQARLGLDLDGTAVFTGPDGSFVAGATSGLWSKGCPSLNASAPEFAEEWVYFECWDAGERRFERTVVLKPRRGESR